MHQPTVYMLPREEWQKTGQTQLLERRHVQTCVVLFAPTGEAVVTTSKRRNLLFFIFLMVCRMH